MFREKHFGWEDERLARRLAGKISRGFNEFNGKDLVTTNELSDISEKLTLRT